ncbi:MAG: 50S ribosomal protein L4 [Euryarchaeota archaeon]|nr:50S ribosomal protein L4 [Euryarchaeota archaeon]
MKVNVYTLKGGIKSQIDLPRYFEYPYRPDLIKMAVRIFQLNRVQPHGIKERAGMKVAESWGPGHGISKMVPRVGSSSRGANIPNTRGGRAGHPPTTQKVWKRSMNKKMRRLAKYSALSMTARRDMVLARGHRVEGELTLPVVVEDSLEEVSRVKDAIDVLKNLGLYGDIERASVKRVRGGRGKMRGRRYKRKKSVLLVVKNKENVVKGFGNLPGVDIVTPRELNAEVLAPGTHAGRLAIFTEGAIEEIRGWNE